ncbi:hypothetical protein HanOQP8_Chr02g0072561 [Helianthus annuus]|nr:hypothetical protein HanOQP8_Chr02g0072561 [Helianthus annuus]
MPEEVVEQQDNRFNSMFTMDLDLDGSWTFDQIFFSDPSPPSFILSATTDPTYSPLWAFSDDYANVNDSDGRLAGSATLTCSGVVSDLV